MPKQTLKIEGFHGGLNTNADPRDIQDNQSPNLQDAKISNLGKIKLDGRFVSGSSGVDTILVDNRGLFMFKSDFQLDGGSGNESIEVIYNKGTDNNFHLIDSEGTDEGSITNFNSTHPVFYSGDGNLRISDGGFSAQAGVWFGYINYLLFDGLNADAGGSGALGWTQATQEIELTPTVGKCLISTPTAGSDGDTVNSASSEYDGNVYTTVANFQSVNFRVGLQVNRVLTNNTASLISSVVNGTKADNTTDYFVFLGNNNIKIDGDTTANNPSLVSGGNNYTISEEKIFILPFLIPSSSYSNLKEIEIYHYGASGSSEQIQYRFGRNQIEPDIWNVLVMSSNNINSLSLSLGASLTSWVLLAEKKSSGNLDFYISGPAISNNVSVTGYEPGIYEFYHSYLYDDEKQESLPSKFLDADSSNFNKVKIVGDSCMFNFQTYLSPYNSSGSTYALSKRITGSRYYYKIDGNDNLFLIGEADFVNKGFKFFPESDEFASAITNTAETSGTWYNKAAIAKNIKPSEANKIDTFKSLNGFSSSISSISAKYKTAVVHGRRVFIGNIFQNSKSFPDRILKSRINKFDVFPENEGSIDVAVNDGESVIKLEAFADRLLQFKEQSMYVINISENVEFLEDKYENKGCSFDYHVTKTDYGIAWFNIFGAYFFDGKNVLNLLEKDGMRLIDDTTWKAFITDGEDGSADDTDMSEAHIGYLPKERKILITNDGGGSSSDILIYDFILRAWTKSINRATDDSTRTNFIVDGNGDLVYYHFDTVAKVTYNPDPVDSTNFVYETKDIDFGQPSVRKKIYKVYLSYKGDARKVEVKYCVNGLSPSNNFCLISSDGSTTGTGATAKCLNFSGASNSSPGTDDWLKAELKPGASINNINSFRLKINADGSNGIAADFEINDITIVYRLKNVK